MNISRFSPLLLIFSFTLCLPMDAFSQCDPDLTSPTAVCYSFVNLSLPASGTLVLQADFIDAGSIDNCTAQENLTFSITPSSVSCADIGTPVMATLTVTDEAGNTNVCNSELTIEDKSGPLLVCHSNINVSLPANGMLTLTPALILDFAQDNCGLTYEIIPPTVSCADIGTPVNVVITATDPGGNSNSCSSTVVVEDKTDPLLICNELTNVALEAGGTLTLTPEMILDFFEDNCELTFTITPSEVTCADKGETVPVTIEATDPGGNSNICSGNVFVKDPRPDDVEILGPEDIICGASGIVFNSIVTGGAGPFVYEWVIKKGASDGWVITSGQGTPSITMDAGIKKLKLELTVFDVCGKKRKDSYKKTCFELSGLLDNEGSAFLADSGFGEDNTGFKKETNLVIYPNPASNIANIHFENDWQGTLVVRVVNTLGQIVLTKDIEKQKGAANWVLDLNPLTPGVHQLLISDGERMVSKPLVKI